MAIDIRKPLSDLHSVKSNWMNSKELAEFNDKVTKLRSDVSKSKPEDYTQDVRNELDGLDAHAHHLKAIQVEEALKAEEAKKAISPDYKVKSQAELEKEVALGTFVRVDKRTVAEVIAEEESRHLIDPSYTPKTQKQVEADRLKLGLPTV